MNRLHVDHSIEASASQQQMQVRTRLSQPEDEVDWSMPQTHEVDWLRSHEQAGVINMHSVQVVPRCHNEGKKEG